MSSREDMTTLAREARRKRRRVTMFELRRPPSTRFGDPPAMIGGGRGEDDGDRLRDDTGKTMTGG